jgi:hypothetical protein
MHRACLPARATVKRAAPLIFLFPLSLYLYLDEGGPVANREKEKD